MESFQRRPQPFFQKIEDENYTHLFFYYNHTLDDLRIYGTNAIPEISYSSLLAIAVLLFTVLVIFLKVKFLFRDSLTLKM